jgi:hypothetical protein
MENVRTTYACAACKGSFPVTVLDVPSVTDLLGDRGRATDGLPPEVAALVAAAGPSPAEIAKRDAALQLEWARKVLREATCPGCRARNPEGVAAQRRERAMSRWGMTAFFAAVAWGSMYLPKLALIAPAMMLIIVALRLAMRAPGRVRTLVLGLPLPVAMTVFVFALPYYAFAVPLASALLMIAMPSPVDDAAFQTAAGRLRFETSPFRG